MLEFIKYLLLVYIYFEFKIINGDLMNFALILAGGFGTRMGQTKKPKQFLELGDKPVLIHTIEKFAILNDFEKIIVLTPKEWITFTEDLVKKYIPTDNIVVIEGGELRIDTINNGMEYILANYDDGDHIIVTHDAVRPFVTHKIIKENISKANEYGACDTIIPSTDTIVESKDDELLSNIPERRYMYQGQTPQSFNLNKLKSFYDKLTDEEKQNLTDACKVFILNGEDVAIVKGDVSNIKITYSFDLNVANFILEGDSND